MKYIHRFNNTDEFLDNYWGDDYEEPHFGIIDNGPATSMTFNKSSLVSKIWNNQIETQHFRFAGFIMDIPAGGEDDSIDAAYEFDNFYDSIFNPDSVSGGWPYLIDSVIDLENALDYFYTSDDYWPLSFEYKYYNRMVISALYEPLDGLDEYIWDYYYDEIKNNGLIQGYDFTNNQIITDWTYCGIKFIRINNKIYLCTHRLELA